MTSFQFIEVSMEEGTAVLRINRPPVNAIGRGLLDELEKAVAELQNEPKAKVMVVASAIQHVFMAGVDLKEMAQLTTAEEVAEIIRRGQAVFSRIENSEKPVIAAIHGACLGGGQELAMACHIRIASDKTRFVQPEIALGIIPGFGGTQRLARIVGPSRAAELILTADVLSAQEAFRMGLVNHVVPDGALLKTAKEMAKKIARYSLPAIRAAMRAIGRGLDVPLDEGLRREAEEFRSIAMNHDMKEGIQAFLEKRQPKFTDS
ncbi:MAG: enoyl-CoA hydratase/isomerase family protein [Candidatus Omnitrophica bacterium]|nr:enoyl-CoA hydratase/isomerase family protein [Candidatus Omnitrophota bacterium]